MAVEYGGGSMATGTLDADDTPGITVNAGPDLCMLLFLTDRDTNANSSGPVFGGDSFTVINHFTSNTPAIQAWYLVNPDVASGDITINPSGYNNIARCGFAVVFSGVDQDDPIEDYAMGDGGSASLTLDADDMAVICVAEADNTNQWEVYSPGAGQTNLYNDYHTRIAQATGSISMQDYLGYELGEASPSATITGSPNYFAVALAAAPGGVASRRASMIFSLAGLSIPVAMGEILVPTVAEIAELV